jgi:DNA-binding LacI/PurR family transcriptional regulator
VHIDEGAPPVTMRDVAERAGVSRALVSIVFRGVPGASPANRDRVMRAAEELSYRRDEHARLLRSSRTRTIGVVFGLHHEFHAQLVESLYRAADTADYDLALGAVSPARGEQRAVQSLIDHRCEALILIGSVMPRRDIEELAARRPVVTMARALRSSAVDVVRTDDAAGARLAVEHLIDLGHRRIVHVHGDRSPGAAERRKGYSHAMRAAKLESDMRLIRGGLTEEDGERAAKELLSSDPPTAVVAFNDHCAAGIQATARKCGVPVPERLSIVGYDDSHIAGLSSVALTTVAQDAQALADHTIERAAAWADRTIDQATEIVVPPHLVQRHSAAPLAM